MPETSRVVVLGASAGGVGALSRLVGVLPADLPAAVLVVLHTSASAPSVLPRILTRAGTLPAVTARHGQRVLPGHVYVAPPDHHLTLVNGSLALNRGPKINGVRPAVDVLFRSAAACRGPQVIAAVLSGTRDDGTLGVQAVKAAGGTALAQSLDDAEFPGMPRSAAARVALDAVGSAEELGRLIEEATHVRRSENGRTAVPVGEDDPPSGRARPGGGGASGLTCPDCGGALWEGEQDGIKEFACHEGHSYAPVSFAQEQSRSLEQALWTATRALDERAALLRKLSGQVAGNSSSAARRFEEEATRAEGHARIIRDEVLAAGVAVPDAEEPEPTGASV